MPPKVDRILLYEQYRLVERSEHEVNTAWKGAHLLLFFLAFVFGSFCTFCFHMLIYLFDEKCVLFPKLLSLSVGRSVAQYRSGVLSYTESSPSNKIINSALPVDFLSTQWVEKSYCYLPTYVPLLSGIFGLVWTTMFLMCSTGSRTLSGLQRPWRVLLPVFIFSAAMGALCIYTTAVTHSGLLELCSKLGEITGSTTCSYTINVVTLLYERSIRGVYQAIRLTIIAAWLHTMCWVLSALVTLARIIMVVDFRLVRIKAELQGDIDQMLERYETIIRSVSPETVPETAPKSEPLIVPYNDEKALASSSSKTSIGTKVHFENRTFASLLSIEGLVDEGSDLLGKHLYFSKLHEDVSQPYILKDDKAMLTHRTSTVTTVPEDKGFISKWLYDLVEDITDLFYPSNDTISDAPKLSRQMGQEIIRSLTDISEGQIKEILVSESLSSTDIPYELDDYLLHLQNHPTKVIDAIPTTSFNPSVEEISTANEKPTTSFDHASDKPAKKKEWVSLGLDPSIEEILAKHNKSAPNFNPSIPTIPDKKKKPKTKKSSKEIKKPSDIKLIHSDSSAETLVPMESTWTLLGVDRTKPSKGSETDQKKGQGKKSPKKKEKKD